MSLNDHFLLPSQAEEEANNPTPSVNVFAPSAAGEMPQVLDNVEFIAVPDEQLVSDGAALESICVAMRDIQLFSQEIERQGGVSLNMALEAMSYLPGLITEQNPKEFYTSSASRTMLSHALEEQEVETKNLIQRGLEVLRNFFGRIVGWFKDKMGKLFGKEKLEEAKKREADLNAKLQEAAQKAAEMAEKYEQLKRASAQDNDNFLKELATVNGKVAEQKAQNNELTSQLDSQKKQTDEANARAATAEKTAETVQASSMDQAHRDSVSIANLKDRLRDVQAQMRNLDATKSREIAEALDRLEKLQRQAESSRSARLDLQEKNDELRVTVNRIIVKTFGEKIDAKKNQLAEAFNAFARSRVLSSPVVAKYMLGNGIQRRTQSINTKAEFMVNSNVLIEHAKKIKDGIAKAETDPQALVTAINSFDFTKLSTGDEVSMKTSFSEADLQGIPAARLEGFIKEMQTASVEAFKKAEGFRFGELVREFEEILKHLQGDTRLKMDYKFANPVVEAYKALQAHVSKLLPYIQRAAQTAQELIALSSSLIAVMPARASFSASEQFKTFVAEVINETAAYVSVSPNFIRAEDPDIVGLSIAALEQSVRN